MGLQTVLILLGANVLGGATYAGMKLAREGMPDFWIVAIRIAVVLIGSAALMGRGALRWEYRGKDLGLLLLVSIVGFAAPVALTLPGLAHAPSVNASVLILLEPIGIVLLSALFLEERATRVQGAGILLGLAGSGVVILGGAGKGGAGDGEMLGNLILAVQGLLWSVWTVAGKPLLKRHSALSLSYATAVVALACVLPFLPSGPLRATPQGWAWSLGVGVAMLVSSWLWNEGLRRVSATVVASFIFVQPVTGALIGSLLGESLTAWTLLGGGLSFAAVVLVSVGERKPSVLA